MALYNVTLFTTNREYRIRDITAQHPTEAMQYAIDHVLSESDSEDTLMVNIIVCRPTHTTIRGEK